MTDINILQAGSLKVGDTAPKFRAELLDDNGDPVDLSGFTADFRIRLPDADTTKIDGGMTVSNTSDGIVEYEWSSGDTDEAGLFIAEIETTDGTDTTTYPSVGYFNIHITENLK